MLGFTSEWLTSFVDDVEVSWSNVDVSELIVISGGSNEGDLNEHCSWWTRKDS